MKVNIYNQQKDVVLRRSSVKPVVVDVLQHEACATNEVSIYFVTSDEICRLHQEFFNDSSPTDCITFPLDDKEEQQLGYHILGEIFICPQAAIDYAQMQLESELSLYLIHGLLHLLGYDDVDPEEARKMRAAEERHMERLIAKKLLLKL